MKRGGNLLRKTGLARGGPLDRAPGPKLVRCKICRGLLPSDTDDSALVCDCGSDWGDGPKPAGSLKRSGPIVPKPRSARVGGASGQPRPRNDFSPATRALVRKRSGGICEVCGRETAVLHHHRRPRRRDGWRPGTNEAGNALHLGVECNERIEHQDRAGALAVGQLLHAEQDPAVEPVLYRGVLVLLSDDGSVTAVEVAA